MPQGGTLRLSASEEGDGSDRRAVLSVEDEGVGIPPEEVDGIFQPFRGSFGKGTGLGLAIVHRIVTDYGGHIDVRPRTAGGTEFRITFPASRVVPARQAS
jgi:signal transduction histidine kinase